MSTPMRNRENPSLSKPETKTMARVVCLPDFEERLFLGIGLRYSTRVGPVRLDTGVLLDRRSDGADDIVQIYVSIGQAF